MKAPIAEIFETIQGEGRNIGMPSIFVRFWGCNLRCRFDGIQCDTPYAVFMGDKQLLSCEEIVNQIKQYKAKNIVFTGGEPMLFQNMIVEVAKQLPEYTFEVETNATIKANIETAALIHQFNMSVKLKSSHQLNDNYDKVRINHEAIASFPKEKSYFKLVVTCDDDLKEIKELTKQHDYEVWLMPEGAKREAVLKNSLLTIKLCIENGYRFCPREHIVVWNGEKMR